MADTASSSKKLSELRVVDLKAELEKRGLEKTGVKASLTDRLKKALEEEGHDPEVYCFEIVETPLKKPASTPGKKTRAVVTEDAKNGQDGDEEGDEEDEVEELEESKDASEDVEMKEVTAAAADAEKSNENEEATSEATSEAAAPVAPAAPADEVKMETDAKVLEDANEEDVMSLSAEDEDKLLADEVETAAATKTETTEEEAKPSEKNVQESKTSEDTVNNQEEKTPSPIKDFSAPPTPTSIPVLVPFTSQDTINLNSASLDRKDDDISLIVHADDDTQFDLDNDLLGTPARADSEKNGTSDEATGSAPDSGDSKAKDGATEGSGTAGGDAKAADAKPAHVSGSTDSAAKSGGSAEGKKNEEKTGKIQESKDASKTTAAAKSTPAKATAAKDDKSKSASASSRNLWVSGLASTTRATDLKTLFSKYGKVVGAKVVTNAKSPGSRCYGFITMSSAEEASKCIQHLHRTELHGRMISVERAKSDPASQAKAANAKAAPGSAAEKKEKEEKERKEAEKREASRRESARGRRPAGRGDYRDHRPYGRRDSRGRHSRERHERSRSRHESTSRSSLHGRAENDKDKKDEKDIKKPEKPEETKTDAPAAAEKKVGEADVKPDAAAAATAATADGKTEEKGAEDKKDILSFDQIKSRDAALQEERERERLRQRERALREEERRRRREIERVRERQRDIERRQREEEMRLQRERDRIRLEREKLERDRLEAEKERLRQERERRERERIEREREEKRMMEQLRFEEQQRRAQKRTYDRNARDEYWADPKRPAIADRHGEFDRRGGSGSGRNYEESRTSENYERRVERYDRRDGRAINNQGRNDREAPRFEDRREESRRGGGGDSRRDTVPTRETARDRDDRRFDDRRPSENRYDKGSGRAPSRDRRENAGPASRDRHDLHDRPRDSRIGGRESPRRDSRSEWKSTSGAPDRREPHRDSRYESGMSKDRGAGNDRGYSDSRVTGSSRDSNWHGGGASSQASGLADDRSRKAAYNPGPGLLGTHLGTAPARGQWTGSDRGLGPTGGLDATALTRTADGWPPVGIPGQRTADIRPQQAGLVLNQPLIQNPPTSQAFLASAANIMMGVGLAGGRPQDARYDAYKNLSGGTIRRY